MNNFEIITGYIPGIIGRVSELHAQYYSQKWNFGRYFEAKVATDLSNFINNYDQTKDCIWSISIDGVIEGSISIDGSSEKPKTAHLRWFIVSDKAKGNGAGNHLMKQAMTFCSHVSYEKVYLWTFQGLESAKHLYQKFGFELVEKLNGLQWGTTVNEQRYEVVIQ